MFKRILIPVDGSPQANAALPAGRTLARALSADVLLVRVVHHGNEVAAAEKATRAVGDELRQSDIKVETLVRVGRPAENIVAAIREPAPTAWSWPPTAAAACSAPLPAA